MVYATTRDMLAADVRAALHWVWERERGREVVVVGHSSGGGLAQVVLSSQGEGEGGVRVRRGGVVGGGAGVGGGGLVFGLFFSAPFFFLLRFLLFVFSRFWGFFLFLFFTSLSALMRSS